jgi:hypothetical protein
MNRSRRLLIEILTPPFLGALIYTLGGYGSDNLLDRITLFPVFLVAVYCFGSLPSLLYALIMEIWFSNRLHKRLGIIATLIVSLLLGACSGFCVFALSKVFIQGSGSDLKVFLGIGNIVGIGMCFIFLYLHDRK